MLGKLLKHEFRATARVMLLVYAAVAAAAVLANLSIRMMDVTDDTFLNILFGLLITLFFLMVAAAAIITIVVMIGRFYRSLLKEQGYLMHTLPVTVHGHIWSKLIVSLVWFVATFVLLSLLVMATVFIQSGTALGDLFLYSPDEFVEILQADGLSVGDLTRLGLEWSLYGILALLTLCLHFYAAMSLGQMFSKNQILLSVVFFIAINMVFNAMTTITYIYLLENPHMVATATQSYTLFSGWMLLLKLVQACLAYVAAFLPLKYRLNLA